MKMYLRCSIVFSALGALLIICQTDLLSSLDDCRDFYVNDKVNLAFLD